MKKFLKLIITSTVLIYNMFPNITFANVYTKLEVGYGKFNKHTQKDDLLEGVSPKSSMIFGGELGYRFNENIRVGINVNTFTNRFNRKFEIINDNPNLSLVPNVPHRDHSEINSQVKSLAGLANIYYDVTYNENVRPYIMAGVGVARHTKSKNYSKIDSVGVYFKDPNSKNYSFAWNAGVGAQIKMDDKISVDLGIKYMDYGKAVSKTADGDKVRTHIKGTALMIGIVYNF